MDWGAIVVAGLGGGSLVALINALANRGKVAAESKKIQADCIDVLAEHYAAELTTLRDKVNALEAKVDGLKFEIENREVTIETLKKENAELTLQVEKMQRAINRRDDRIRELEKQVIDLTARLDAMNGHKTDTESRA